MNTINNQVSLIGNLGKDVQIITFNSGMKKANVSVATTRIFKNAKGESQKETQWHNVVAWGMQAELMGKVLKKGSTVAINGSLSYRSYENKDGQEMRICEVLSDNFLLMKDNRDVEGGLNQVNTTIKKSSLKSKEELEGAPIPF